MRKSGDKQRVLMIDDDIDFQSIVKGWVGPAFDFFGLTRGEDVIGPLADISPDLVILDVRLPGADGFQICSRIRADPRYAELPVLFLTGCKEDADFLRSLDSGGTAFLTKPVTRQEFLAMLGELLSGDLRAA